MVLVEPVVMTQPPRLLLLPQLQQLISDFQEFLLVPPLLFPLFLTKHLHLLLPTYQLPPEPLQGSFASLLLRLLAGPILALFAFIFRPLRD